MWSSETNLLTLVILVLFCLLTSFVYLSGNLFGLLQLDYTRCEGPSEVSSRELPCHRSLQPPPSRRHKNRNDIYAETKALKVRTQDRVSHRWQSNRVYHLQRHSESMGPTGHITHPIYSFPRRLFRKSRDLSIMRNMSRDFCSSTGLCTPPPFLWMPCPCFSLPPEDQWSTQVK